MVDASSHGAPTATTAAVYAVSEPTQCQWMLWVYWYEISIILADPFTKASTSSRSFVLAVVLSVTVLALLVAVVSIFALCCCYAEETEEEREQSMTPAERLLRGAAKRSRAHQQHQHQHYQPQSAVSYKDSEGNKNASIIESFPASKSAVKRGTGTVINRGRYGDAEE